MRVIHLTLVFLFLPLLFVFGEYKTTNLLIKETLKVEAEIAATNEQQALGLGFRENLPEFKGMIFIYDEAEERIFWMKNMKIPIDILWISAGKIVHIEHNVPPPSLLSIQLPTYGHGYLADTVLEVSAGFSKRHGIGLGDSVRFAD